jgi:hypothetical protein
LTVPDGAIGLPIQCSCGRSWLFSVKTPIPLGGGVVPGLTDLRCPACGGGIEKLSLVAGLKQNAIAVRRTFYANVLIWSELEFRYGEVSIRLNSEAEVDRLRQQAVWPLARVLRVRSL